MLPRPLVPPSLVPLLDPEAWLAGLAVLVLLAVLARRLLPDGHPARRAPAALALAALGMYALLELQRRAAIDPVVLSWPGFLLWAGFMLLAAQLLRRAWARAAPERLAGLLRGARRGGSRSRSRKGDSDDD